MPIVTIEGFGKVEFPDSMSQAQIDRAIKSEILPMIAQRVPSASVAEVASSMAGGDNPFSKGTAKADPHWKVRDRYRYRVVDLLTKLESRGAHGGPITEVTDHTVVYSNGRVTDLLGNTIQDTQGRGFIGNQIFVAEYSVGRKWTTVYRRVRRDDAEDEWELDFKVVAREPVTVPAGTFLAFKVEGAGFSKGKGTRILLTYWIAPDRVRSFIAQDLTVDAKGGSRNRFKKADRTELAEFRQR